MTRTRKTRIAAILKDEDALTPKEAAQILGCQEDQVRDYVRGWPVNGRWKFRAGDVKAKRDSMLRKAVEMDRANRRMEREAGR